MSLRHKNKQLARHRQLSDRLSSAPSRLSYYSKRYDQELKTGRSLQREERQRALKALGHFWMQRFGLAILLLCAVVCAINLLSLSSHANVALVQSEPANISLHSSGIYQAAASQLLAGSIWNHTKLTVNTAQLSTGLMKQFPEITHIGVDIPLLAHRPIIYIQLAQPSLVLTNTNGSAVLDNQGRVIAIVSSASTALLSSDLKALPRITDQSGLTLRLGQQTLPNSDVGFIQTVVAQLAARHFVVSSLTLPAATSELDVQVAHQPYTIKFNLQSGDARQQAGTFLAVQANLQSQNITPSSYIDVRVDGRAYYQ